MCVQGLLKLIKCKMFVNLFPLTTDMTQSESQEVLSVRVCRLLVLQFGKFVPGVCFLCRGQ